MKKFKIDNMEVNYITDGYHQLVISLALYTSIRDSIVVSIPACHAGDRGSIPRHGERFLPDYGKYF